ncbi:MAG: glycoside hydrolase family 3 C-terminal domain-containing protein, partial [Nocardioides sp.]|nr:glycoside hydrolase family 3 C-terminal domain-containing protein [Nocardioides sp.]
DLDAHHALARRAAAASAVLLTNDGVLPLDPAAGGPVAVLGALARAPRYQGAGSSHIVPTRLDDPVEELCAALPGRELRVADGYRLDGAPDPALVADAVAAARDATSVVLFLGLPDAEESEGFDREHLDLPAVQLDLLRAVSDVHDRVVVVLGNGGVVLTRPVEELASAVLETWLGGQAVGGAVADLLTGAAEPGGRLAETVPLALADTPAYVNFPGTPAEVLYGERIYVGYRWYDRVGREVAHPFGHGLGYTTWAYDDLEVAVPDPTVAAAAVRFRLTNTGERPGSEVAQVYLADPVASVDRPVRELVGFRKVTLEPGASTVVEVELDERAFAFWDAERHAWRVEPGELVVAVGASSADLRLTAAFDLDVPADLGPLTVDSPMGDWLARPAATAALMEAFAAATGGEAEMPELDADLLRMVESMPLRQVLGMAGVQLDEEGERALVARAEEQPT